jgi:uncharacterized protein YndB with AHSA1/START domain
MTRKHIHKEIFSIGLEKAFELLITPSAIREWWGADRAIVLPEKDGIWMAAWGKNEDAPDYVTAFTMSEYEPPNRILFTDAKYTAGGDKLPFDMDMSTEFLISAVDGGVEIRVIQDGFPLDATADEYYSACEKGWKDTFAGIRKFIDDE